MRLPGCQVLDRAKVHAHETSLPSVTPGQAFEKDRDVVKMGHVGQANVGELLASN